MNKTLTLFYLFKIDQTPNNSIRSLTQVAKDRIFNEALHQTHVALFNHFLNETIILWRQLGWLTQRVDLEHWVWTSSDIISFTDKRLHKLLLNDAYDNNVCHVKIVNKYDRFRFTLNNGSIWIKYMSKWIPYLLHPAIKHLYAIMWSHHLGWHSRGLTLASGFSFAHAIAWYTTPLTNFLWYNSYDQSFIQWLKLCKLYQA